MFLRRTHQELHLGLCELDGIECSGSVVKLVWDNNVRTIAIDDTLQYGLDFYAKSMESMISGYPRGFYDYREIEWMEIVASEKEIERIESSLSAIGSYDIVVRGSSLRLTAYR